MQQNRSKLKRSKLKLSEKLTALERDWLSGCLVSNVGVSGAIYSDKDPHQLFVEYDSSLMNGTDLLDMLYLRGVRAEVRSADFTSTEAVHIGGSARGCDSSSRARRAR